MKGFSAIKSRHQGLTLIEMMIALTLGLLVLAAAGGIFLSNQRTSRTATAMGGLQDAAIFGFEMLARDIREAGSNPCDATLAHTAIRSGMMTATPDGPDWYLAWSTPLYGYNNGTSDVIQVLRAGDEVRTLTADMTAGATTMSFTPAAPNFTSGQVLMVCDGETLSFFGAAGASTSGGSVSFATGGGNSCNYFPRPNATACGGSAATDAYLYKKFSNIAGLHAVRWYVATNDGVSSLYRQLGTASQEEVVRGVSGLSFWYMHEGTYKTAADVSAAAGWRDVTSVRAVMRLEEEGRTGTDGADAKLERQVEYVFAVRNRLL